MARTHRPRAHVTLAIAGNADASILTRIDLTPRSVKIVRNDHNHADEARVTVDWIDAGVDPRMLAGAQVKIHIGEADDFGAWEPTDANLRFVGILTRARRNTSESDRAVDLEFLDYTALFLRFKPFPSKGVPRFDQNVKQAWSTLLSGFTDPSTYQNEIKFLLNSIEFRGLAPPGPVIGQAVPARFRSKKAQVHVPTSADAWAVWQQVVGMLGLMSYFVLDKLVVATADAHYGGGTIDNPPRLVFGENIEQIEEERNNNFERKGVGITSYDPETGRVLEAVWPPAAKKPEKSKPNGPPPEVRSVDYFQVPAVADPDTLLEIAKRAYAERARQEFTGKVTTRDMVLDRENGGLMSVLDLASGDSIRIVLDDFEANGAQIVGGMPSAAQRADYFVRLGYDKQVARLMAERAGDLLTLRGEFHVKTVSVSLDSTEDGGDFTTEIEYLNKIESTGDAIDAA